MTLFDAYVVVDWSAASRPRTGRDSIWIATARGDGTRLDVAEPVNPRTRRDAEDRIADLLQGYVARRRRVLIGFDFPYGYPRGLARALGVSGGASPWRAAWDLLRERIRDDERNVNNRFEVASEMNARMGAGSGPFWGCPPRRQTQQLRTRRKGEWDFPFSTTRELVLHRLRETESRMKGVQETWKLLGAGSVGSQALLGIPCVARLRDRPTLDPHSRVWPFETGFSPRPSPNVGPFILHAEIWPGVVKIDGTLHPVRDAAQVLSLARHAAELDEKAALGRWFGEPPRLTGSARRVCLEEEGWILGA